LSAQRITQVIVTVGALAAAVMHLLRPDLAIDGITLVLLLVAIIPWLLPLFKSLEFPDGWKVEFKDLQDTSRRAANAGLLDEQPIVAPDHEYSFQVVADQTRIRISLSLAYALKLNAG
jgi:hypothetical protein